MRHIQYIIFFCSLKYDTYGTTIVQRYTLFKFDETRKDFIYIVKGFGHMICLQ